MTREEAEKLTKDAWPKVSVGNNYGGLQQGSALGGLSSGMAYAPMSPSAFVELVTALGILKLDEPKSEVEKRNEIACKLAVAFLAWERDPHGGLLQFVEGAGLKIVEK